MKRLLCILLIFISFGVEAQDTYSISGTVNDEKGQPVPGATVFLTNTKEATATDVPGKFILNKLAPGSYQLAIKMLGFAPNVQLIKIQDRSVIADVRLKEASIYLNAVTVKGKPDPDRKKYMQLFIKNFIGQSTNAGRCKIINPEAISFHYDKKTGILQANANDLLVVENDGLGYRVKYLLTEFKDYLQKGVCFYTGYPYFEELTGNDMVKKQWELNRRQAYLGSSRHFFRSVMNNTAEQEGFALYAYKEKLNKMDSLFAGMGGRRPIEYRPFDNTFVTINSGEKALISEHTLAGNDTIRSEIYVVYKGAEQSDAFERSGLALHPPIDFPFLFQISKMRIFSDTIAIDKELLLNPVKNFYLSGYWGWARVAELLPLEYNTNTRLNIHYAEPKLDTLMMRKIAAIDSFHKRQVVKKPYLSFADPVLRDKIAVIDSFYKKHTDEKLYLHTDKPYYAIGDTMRFKAYLLDGALAASAKSGVFYVELINDSSRVCKRQTILIKNGVAWGDIIIKKSWSPGNYTLRAYTNWMRNFGEEHFFKKQVSIGPVTNQYWLVTNQVTLNKNKEATIALHFTDLNHRNIGFHDIQLNVLHETRTLLKAKTRTDGMGNVKIRFSVPEKLANQSLTLVAEDSQDGNIVKLNMPIPFNRPENIDLQFMPEGGNMIAGLPVRIGFKAINEDGRGTDLSGKVYDKEQHEVAGFQSTHLGMGNFEMMPIAGEIYTAKIILLDGTIKSYPLPTVNPSGIALRVDAGNDDSLKVTINNTTPDNNYYLIAQSRYAVYYGEKIIVQNKPVHKKIAKSLLPTGIVELVLLDADNRPVTQRMVFINHKDQLKIAINRGKKSYNLRDSVGLQLKVTDKNGNPVQGSFSLAVTDDNQVKPPDNDDDNITSYMLLSNDLAGNIEKPGWYFEGDNTTTIQQSNNKTIALDNLMLTQGWVGYDWKPVFERIKIPEYEAESKFAIKGRISDVFGLPVPYTGVTLLSVRPLLSLSAKTGWSGRFTFSDFPLLDTIVFHLQPTRDFNVGIDMDEFVPPEVVPAKYPDIAWNVNTDSLLLRYSDKKRAEQEEAFNAGKNKLLKEVIIKDKKIDPRPPLVLAMTEEDVRVARPGHKDMNLWDMLKERLDMSGHEGIRILIDGIPPRGYNVRPPAILRQIRTEDIKGVSVRKNRERIIVYITSNVGRGEIISGMQGYAFRPMPISWPHRFYSPRYTVKVTDTVKDTRSTLFWAPDIITDAAGEASLSFYTADTPGNYTVIMQGSDLNGNIGYATRKIEVAPLVSATTGTVK